MDNQAFLLYDNEHRIKKLLSTNQFLEEDKKCIDVLFFDLKIIIIATNNFSNKNKLGHDVFGSVHKVKILP